MKHLRAIEVVSDLFFIGVVDSIGPDHIVPVEHMKKL